MHAGKLKHNFEMKKIKMEEQAICHLSVNKHC